MKITSNYGTEGCRIYSPVLKFLIVMKLITLFMVVTLCQVHAHTHAQMLTLKGRNTKLTDVLKEIKRQTKYDVISETGVVGTLRVPELNLNNVPLDKGLSSILTPLSLTFVIEQNAVIIKRAVPAWTTKVAPIIEAQKNIKGKVVDAGGQALAGATIKVRNGMSSSTDQNGEFQVNANAGDVLTVELLGFEAQTITIRAQTNYSITMKVKVDALDEVVVVGYGTQKKTSLTGAVSEIKGEELTRRPVSNLQQALQGQVGGLTVLDQGGAPGKPNTTMRVRGVTTIGNNNPLVIVDGIEQAMDFINPNDIETMSLLKDASSTAIYGSRAANGVLLITTKRAKEGGLNVAYDGFLALQKAVNIPEHMGLEDYMRMQNTAYSNVGSKPKYTEDQINEYVNATDRYKFPMPNTWFDVMFKTAPQVNNNISLSGGNESFKGRVSFRQQDQQGLVKNMNAQLYDFRTNVDIKILDNLKVSSDLNYRYGKNRGPASQFNVFNIMLHASQWTVPQYPDGSYGVSPQGRSPMVENELGGYNRQASDFILGNFKADWEIVDGLTLTGQFGLRSEMQAVKNYLNSYEVRDYYNPDLVRVSVPLNNLDEQRNASKEYTLNGLLNYKKTFNTVHDFSTLLGYSQIRNYGNNLSAFRQGFYNNDLQSIGQGLNDATKSNNGGELEWALQSYFGRVNYGYDNKYLFEANGRFDGSSRFTGGNTYSFFPSFSAAWRLSQENFWSGLTDYVNEFKIKGSWGKVGNQAVDLYSYYSTLALINYSFNEKPVQGYTLTKLADPNITWETTTQRNIGVETSFWSHKMSFSADYYHKKTDGILLVLPIPAIMGLTPSAQNAGSVENKGFEFVLGYRENFGDWKFNGNVNFNVNKNKVLNLAGTGPYITGSNVESMFITGEQYPINGFWGYQTTGFFQTQEEVASSPKIATSVQAGDVKYNDRNGDGIINADDMTFLGNSFPTYTFGSSLGLGYKNFELNVLLQGAADVYTRLSGALAEMGNQEGFTHEIYTNNYWTPENTDARFPRPTKFNLLNIQSSDRMLINGSYLRLKNVQLQYSIPSEILAPTFIKSVKCYVSGTNLLTISKLNEWNLDPETPPGRANYYPQTSLYTFGLKLGF